VFIHACVFLCSFMRVFMCVSFMRVYFCVHSWVCVFVFSHACVYLCLFMRVYMCEGRQVSGGSRKVNYTRMCEEGV
jgi:hypothetical protein